VIALGLVGAAIGGVLFALVYRWAPRRASALVELGRFDAHHHAAASAGAAPRRQGGRGVGLGGGQAGRLAARYGISGTTLRQDAALTGRSFDTILAREGARRGGRLLRPGPARGAADQRGVGADRHAAPRCAGLCARAGFALADAGLRSEARTAGATSGAPSRTTSTWCRQEWLGLAAAEQALVDAARLSDQWPMAGRPDLDRARLAGPGVSNWEALAALGQRIGVDELRELGGLVKLVADDGAQVRATLSARAASMRRHELADAEGEDAEREQSMRLAQMLIVAGFLVFIGYPALSNVLLS
jgi:hypothetical protein